MKIKEILEQARKKLIENNIEDASIICKQLLAYVLNKDKQYLVINMDEEVAQSQHDTFNTHMEKIINGYPLQYITQNQEFMGINFYVDENVLIPQPDTEILVENVLKICSKIREKQCLRENVKSYSVVENNVNENNKKIKILDLCTGSGAIAISLKSKVKDAQIFASDISEKALEVAEKNSKLNQTEVKFIKSDLFENIKEKDFDIIISNPPYIKTEVIPTLSKQVRSEPMLALDGGQDGLDIYRKIIEIAHRYIKNNGYLCLEIGYDQKEEVTKLLEQYKNYTQITTIKDLSNNDRCIITRIAL